MLPQQLNQFFLALSFFSRLPMLKNLHYSPEAMHRATKYYPLVGIVLASLISIIYLIAALLWSTPVALIVLMCSSLMLTGALHEDGLADCFDGFYGGQNQQHKLEIMKDSRLGTYGSAALICSLLLKFFLLQALAEHSHLFLSIAVAYPLSRAIALSLVQDLNYVSSVVAKSEALAKPLSRMQLSFTLFTGSMGCFFSTHLAFLEHAHIRLVNAIRT